jgi:hypothetical protein
MDNQPSTVLNFRPALEAGHEPRDYTYQTEDVPTGEYEARLDFMIWSHKQVAINCYLTVISTGQRIRLTAYRNQADDYFAGETAVRFLPFGSVLAVTVGLNGAGNPKWTNAVLMATGEAGLPPDEPPTGSFSNVKTASFFCKKKEQAEVGQSPTLLALRYRCGV